MGESNLLTVWLDKEFTFGLCISFSRLVLWIRLPFTCATLDLKGNGLKFYNEWRIDNVKR